MKHVPLFAAAVMALVVSGCGGGGSSSNGSTGPTGNTNVPPDDATIEAILAPNNVIPTDPSQYQVEDPLDLVVNQEVEFQLVSYDSNGNRTVYGNVQWSSTDTGTYGSLSSDTGLYQIGTRQTPSSLSVKALCGGKAFYTPYNIRPEEAYLQGQILDSVTNKPLRNATIQFYDGNGTIVGTVRQPFQGNFRATLPLSAANYEVLVDSVPTGYWPDYEVNGLHYQGGNDLCRPTIQGLVNGSDNANLTVYLVPKSQAEPSDDGCGS